MQICYSPLMRLHRFFITEQLKNRDRVTILDRDVLHQWKNVFRLKAGDRVILLDNSGSEYVAEFELLSKEKAELAHLEVQPPRNGPQKEVWLFAALIKKDNFEWILEKGTELGVSHFVPIISQRSEKKNLNVERAQKILKEASEQSGRTIMPELHEIVELKELLTESMRTQLGIENLDLVAFHTDGITFTDENEIISMNRIGVLIGPEGGWTDRELELFKHSDIPVYCLGTQVLRAETAAIAISSLLLL
jgi:16S rRNA (uracil1498-N3)-methyltransferase